MGHYRLAVLPAFLPNSHLDLHRSFGNNAVVCGIKSNVGFSSSFAVARRKIVLVLNRE
jgi:hypothetical protein